jgi:hypothetical protein
MQTRRWGRVMAWALAATTSGTAFATTAEAQAGPFVGIQYAGASVSVEDAATDLDFGSGFGVHAGIAMRRWAILANFDRSVLTRDRDDVRLTQYDALVRANLIPASAFQLFLTGGVTGRSASRGEDFQSIAPTGGAGAQLFLTSRLAANGTLLWTFGNLTRAEQLGTSAPAGTFRTTQTRVHVGVSLYPFGR